MVSDSCCAETAAGFSLVLRVLLRSSPARDDRTVERWSGVSQAELGHQPLLSAPGVPDRHQHMMNGVGVECCTTG